MRGMSGLLDGAGWLGSGVSTDDVLAVVLELDLDVLLVVLFPRVLRDGQLPAVEAVFLDAGTGVLEVAAEQVQLVGGVAGRGGRSSIDRRQGGVELIGVSRGALHRQGDGLEGVQQGRVRSSFGRVHLALVMVLGGGRSTVVGPPSVVSGTASVVLVASVVVGADDSVVVGADVPSSPWSSPARRWRVRG